MAGGLVPPRVSSSECSVSLSWALGDTKSSVGTPGYRCQEVLCFRAQGRPRGFTLSNQNPLKTWIL